MSINLFAPLIKIIIESSFRAKTSAKATATAQKRYIADSIFSHRQRFVFVIIIDSIGRYSHRHIDECRKNIANEDAIGI